MRCCKQGHVPTASLHLGAQAVLGAHRRLWVGGHVRSLCCQRDSGALMFLDAKSYHPVSETSEHTVLSKGNRWPHASCSSLERIAL